MKYIKTFEEFTENFGSVDEAKYMPAEDRKYMVDAKNVKGLIKAVEALPDTIGGIRVPDEPSGNTSGDDIKIKKGWKKKVLKYINKAMKDDRSKDVDTFSLQKALWGSGKDAETYHYMITFSSDGSRRHAKAMSSGKYGKLD